MKQTEFKEPSVQFICKWIPPANGMTRSGRCRGKRKPSRPTEKKKKKKVISEILTSHEAFCFFIPYFSFYVFSPSREVTVAPLRRAAEELTSRLCFCKIRLLQEGGADGRHLPFSCLFFFLTPVCCRPSLARRQRTSCDGRTTDHVWLHGVLLCDL